MRQHRPWKPDNRLVVWKWPGAPRVTQIKNCVRKISLKRIHRVIEYDDKTDDNFVTVSSRIYLIYGFHGGHRPGLWLAVASHGPNKDVNVPKYTLIEIKYMFSITCGRYNSAPNTNITDGRCGLRGGHGGLQGRCGLRGGHGGLQGHATAKYVVQ